ASTSFVVSDNRTYPNSNQNINVELCNLQNGAIDLTVTGGVTPYSFTWSSGHTTEDLSNITDGIYAVTISGANNCTATATVNVPDNDVSFSINGTPVNNTSCVAVNGAVDLDILPGDPGNGLSYTYQWSNNVFTQDQANLDAGIYAVTVSAGGTCTATASYNLVNDAQSPNVAVAVSPAFCGQNSGLVDLTVTGGQTPYIFNWSTGSPTEDLTAVPPGTYSVTVTGGNGCTTIDNYDVTENVTIPSISGVPTSNTSCVANNGAIALSVTPVTLTYTYVWSSGQSTPNLQAIPGGSYSVTVSAGGSCIGVASFNVPNDITTVSLGGSTVDVLCFGNSTGAVNLNVNTGTPPYQYSWSPAAGNVEDLSNLTSGNYLVTVTDANGCSAATAFNVQQPASLVQVNCQLLNDVTSPASTDGAGAVNISGGTPPYDVAWNPGGTQNNVIPGVFTIDNLAQGAYLVNITDNNGCPATCNFNIGLVPCQTSVGTLSNSLISLCGSGCISANYNAANQFLDPNDALQFVLHEGTTNQIVNEITRSNQPTFCFDPSIMQYGVTYYISAVAGNADPSGNVILNAYCTVISFPTPIVFFEKPVASIVQPFDLNCEVREVNLIGSSNLPGSTYLWTTLDGTLIGSVTQANAKAGKAGNYEFFVTVNGCKDTSAVQVLDISNSPEAIIAATPDDLLDCVIDEITLLGTAEGTFNANLIWISNGNQYTPGTTLQIDNPGTYQFVILDTLTRCADTAQIVINENLQYPPLFLNPPSVLTCNNPATTLVGGSPFPGIQYQWAVISGSDTTIVGSGGNLQVNTPGVYWIFGIDPVNQCKNSLSTTVNANQILPTAEAGPGFSIKCFGETANLSGSATSGSGQINYQWSTGNGFIVNGATSAAPLINKPGTYVLLVTDPSNGCTDSDNVIINPIDPTAMATVTQPPCFGDKGSIIVDEVIGGKPPVMFSLNDGPLTIQNSFYNLNPGPYTVVVQDAEGCSTTLSALLIEPEEFQIFVVPEVTIDLGESYQIITQISPPLTPLESVRWTPSTGLSCDTCLILTANPWVSTQYKVEVKTEAGCRDNATLRLLVDRRVDVYIPNIFSPDGDGENDYFTVYADTKGVLKINSLQVYSRWGELLWENYDFQPNNPSIGWDGTYRGQDMNPAVFVYQAEVEFIDGRKELFKGDVTIKR
ncbi:MAG: gliding motility-associated C-terminal domain-containing protein, partial [Saprospiraceae bacterium]|nr:gliding motility-associated C-terminal domain-containing protein [Saprospiraceae bacterium]